MLINRASYLRFYNILAQICKTVWQLMVLLKGDFKQDIVCELVFVTMMYQLANNPLESSMKW